MTKTIIALNGSARKSGSSASLLQAFLEGVRENAPELSIEQVNVFDLDGYKGCRGCHACELKTRSAAGCVQRMVHRCAGI